MPDTVELQSLTHQYGEGRQTSLKSGLFFPDSFALVHLKGALLSTAAFELCSPHSMWAVWPQWPWGDRGDKWHLTKSDKREHLQSWDVPKKTQEHGAGLLAGIVTLGSTSMLTHNIQLCFTYITYKHNSYVWIWSYPQRQTDCDQSQKRDLAKECKESRNCL